MYRIPLLRESLGIHVVLARVDGWRLGVSGLVPGGLMWLKGSHNGD